MTQRKKSQHTPTAISNHKEKSKRSKEQNDYKISLLIARKQLTKW